MKNKLNSFIFILALISLIADIITIQSVIFSSEQNSEGVFIYSPIIEISNWHLTFLWIISLLTFFGILKIYWQNNLESGIETFKEFILHDVILSFNYPFLLIPGIIIFLLIFLIWGFIVGIVLYIVGMLFLFVLGLNDHEDNLPNINPVMKKTILNEWSELSKRIEIELQRNQWISSKTLKDWGHVNNVSLYALDFALKKYASQNPTISAYSSIYEKDKKGNFRFKVQSVLISINNLNREKYRY